MELTPLPQQLRAIEAPPGPVLVVAGPGAGKTFCLISRVQHLVTVRGLRPSRICAVTFTNKAAEEIAIRLRRSLGQPADDITRGTLHALCLSVLRDHAEAAGLTRGFGVADDAYQRTVLGRLGIAAKRRSTLLTFFSRRRLQDYPLTHGDEKLFREYQRYLTQRNVVDFDDIVVKTDALLREHATATDGIAGRWDALLVDEFQDLNPVQYAILKRLAPHRDFFAVGDDEQSIFSWTGADPRMLDSFRHDYGVEPIVLDRNCRSSRQIFEVARRLVETNPQLFNKKLSADRESTFTVVAREFPDEEMEAAWLVEDLRADRAASGLEWGDYALLYRKHEVGNFLETQLLRAGIPCRLARGRSLAEDEVVGYVIAALRLMRDPADSVPLEAFARRVFAEQLLQEVHTVPTDGTRDFLDKVRALAKARPRNDPDGKKLWRFIYQTENLAALARSTRTLGALVEELLSQNIGPYQNRLEERHDELTDPAATPAVVALARRLEQVVADQGRILIAPMGGLEIGVRGMLIAAGLHRVPSASEEIEPRRADLRLTEKDGGDLGLPLTLFKALQLVHARSLDDTLRDCVTFDFETTDNDAATCEIVEIGAARVVGGEVVDRFHALVRPSGTISPGATRVHGYTDTDVRDAPSFAEVWPAFRAFVGNDVLVAHNGQRFDVPVLRRLAAGAPGVGELVFFDTLPLARTLSPGSAKLADLAARFGISTGRGHHALDDALTLAGVLQELGRQKVIRARKSVLSNLLDYVALALALDAHRRSDEAQMLFDMGRRYALGRFSDCLEFYGAERERHTEGTPTLEEVVDRLGGRDLMIRLQAEPDPAQRYPAAVARLRGLMGDDAELPSQEGVERLLDRVALSTSEGVAVAPDRVTLLTLHSTKGLEFSRVYIVGVEDFQLPGYYAITDGREDEIQEARRLLYVGMTRARDRLILTRVERRFGRDAGGSQFLREMNLI